MAPVRGFPASVISAIEHLPAAIALRGMAEMDQIGAAAVSVESK